MQIVCSQCQAEYEIDPPAAPFGRLQDLVFRCTACGGSIPIREETSPDQAPSAAEEPAAKFVLRQNGKSYNVKDSATMQRWIVERRVWVDDEVSVDGGGYARVGELDEFKVFFKLVSDADRAIHVPEPAALAAPNPPDRRAPDGKDTGVSRDRKTAPSKSKSLFARPVGLSEDDTSGADAVVSRTAGPVVSSPNPERSDRSSADAPVRAELETPSTTGDEGRSTAEEREQAPSGALSVAPVVPVPTQDAVPVTVEEWELGEALPDDSGASVLPASTAQDAIDMELDEEDFFSEEQSALALGSLDDEDDEFEWGQKRRSNMLVWWLLFLGALGGSGYGALEWLNRADESAVTSEAADGEPDASAPAATNVEPDDPEANAETVPPIGAADPAEKADSEAEDVDGTKEPVPNPVTPPASAADEPATDGPGQTANAAATKAMPPAPKAAPTKPSASRETDRGWAQLDRGNFDAARKHFNAALAATSGYPDARFGLAYVNEKQGRVDEAVRQYCRLSTGSSGSVKSEADGRLRSLDRACP